MDHFDSWNTLKKCINIVSDSPTCFPKEGEVWMLSLGQNIGFEQNGSGARFSRPALVLKKFNNQMFLAVPLSTKQKNFDFYCNYTDPNQQKVSAIIAQIRLVSVKRFERKMYDVNGGILSEIKQRLRSWF